MSAPSPRHNEYRPNPTEPVFGIRYSPPAHLAPTVLKPPSCAGDLGMLGQYRVRRVLGSGGMGTVYLAVDPKLFREIALKVMHPRCAVDPVARVRFFREARAQAAIEHEHVVPIFHVGEAGGVPFLTMPRLKGRTLAAALPGWPIPIVELLRVGREIAEGLAAAHEVGVVHRDIKPGNIWLDWDGGRVKILDFGVTKVLNEQEGGIPLTAYGSIVGTPSYMSPEQAQGRPVDGRSDLFSLGSVLYEMATGRRPFRGSTSMEILLGVVGHEPSTPGTLNPLLPPSLSRMIMQLLAKRRNKRPTSASEVAGELAWIAGEWQAA